MGRPVTSRASHTGRWAGTHLTRGRWRSPTAACLPRISSDGAATGCVNSCGCLISDGAASPLPAGPLSDALTLRPLPLRGPLEHARRRARRVDLPRNHAVEQFPHVGIVLERLLELTAHPERRDREHLVHQVAPPALDQRALGLDVRAVLVELLGELLDPGAFDRLG